MLTTTGTLSVTPSNEITAKVIKKISGHKTPKQVIQEYFGLDDRIVMDADGISVLEVFNDFIDPEKLQEKGVTWIPQLESLGVSKEYFDSLLAKYIAYGQKDSSLSNGSAPQITGVVDSKKPTRGGKKVTAK